MVCFSLFLVSLSSWDTGRRGELTHSGDGKGVGTDRDELPEILSTGPENRRDEDRDSGAERLTIPGRWKSRGSFWVMRRYMKAADIRKAMRKPVPWVVMAASAAPVAPSRRLVAEESAAEMRAAAKGAVSRRG